MRGRRGAKWGDTMGANGSRAGSRSAAFNLIVLRRISPPRPIKTALAIGELTLEELAARSFLGFRINGLFLSRGFFVHFRERGWEDHFFILDFWCGKWKGSSWGGN